MRSLSERQSLSANQAAEPQDSWIKSTVVFIEDPVAIAPGTDSIAQGRESNNHRRVWKVAFARLAPPV